MKVVLSTVGRFHMFALARELERQGALECVYSGFPWAALKRERVDRGRVRTFPYVRPLLMLSGHSPLSIPHQIMEAVHHLSLTSLDAYVKATLPACDVFVGHEGAGLWTGRAAQKRGIRYVCDRGCSHMGWKEALLKEEYDRVGLRYPGRPRTYDREIAEYEAADLIVVPSSFARDSFTASGISPARVATVPYGVNLDNFHPVARKRSERFEVLFVGGLSVRKGAHDLFSAFDRLAHPHKRLTVAGTISKEIRGALAGPLARHDVHVMGPVPHLTLKTLMANSDVLSLPSIEDGFGMVLVEALACGCPIIATTNTGGPDLITDGVEGYLVPIRAPDVIAERLQTLADNPDLQKRMSEAAALRAQAIGGWRDYGRAMAATYEVLLGGRS